MMDMSEMIDPRNLQFAMVLTELSGTELTPQMQKEFEIVKLTIMNIGRENTVQQGDDPNQFSDGMGALTLLLMATKWMIQTDLLTMED
jgi:hypothetical protein